MASSGEWTATGSGYGSQNSSQHSRASSDLISDVDAGRKTPAYAKATLVCPHKPPCSGDEEHQEVTKKSHDRDSIHSVGSQKSISDMSDQEIYRLWRVHQAPEANVARIQRGKPPYWLQILRWEEGHLYWEAFKPASLLKDRSKQTVQPGSKNAAIPVANSRRPLFDRRLRMVELDLPPGTQFRRWRLNHEDELFWHELEIPDNEIAMAHHFAKIVAVWQPHFANEQVPHYQHKKPSSLGDFSSEGGIWQTNKPMCPGNCVPDDCEEPIKYDSDSSCVSNESHHMTRQHVTVTKDAPIHSIEPVICECKALKRKSL